MKKYSLSKSISVNIAASAMMVSFCCSGVYAIDPIKDTARALVVYDDFESEDDHNHQVEESYHNMDDNPIYNQLSEMSDRQIGNMIDSLMDLNHIPYKLINQINHFLVYRPDLIAKVEEEESELISEIEPYPAHKYYKSWNTEYPFPYNRSKLSKHDSTLELHLGDVENFIIPTQGVITSKFGWRHGRPHNGIDVDLEVWDTVRCAWSGTVRMSKYYGGFGRVVIVRHDNGLESLYAHLHRLKVKPGDRVEAGDLVGLGGSSGHSTGSHLHFEVRFKGYPLNPLIFLDWKNETPRHDTLVLKKMPSGFAAFPKDAVFHTVEKGEFLYKIAKQYGLTTKEICEINGISRNKILRVGDKIRIS